MPPRTSPLPIRIPLMPIRILFLALAFLAACVSAPQDAPPAECMCPAPEPPPAPAEKPSPFVQGDRLVPNVWAIDDGGRAPTGTFFDRERGETCSFVRVEAGTYCLPAFVWHSKPGMYSDSMCTREVALVDACDELPQYVRDKTSKPWETCEPRPLGALYPLGEPRAVGKPLYSLTNGSCSSKTIVDAMNAALPLGPPIPLSEFASAEVVPFEGGL